MLDAFAVTPAGSAPDTIAHLGSAAAASLDHCRIRCTDGSIGQGSGRNSKGAGCCGLDGNFIRHLRSVSAAPGYLYGEGVGSRARWRSSEVQRSRSAGRFRGDTGGQRSRCNRPFVGSAAAAPVDDCEYALPTVPLGREVVVMATVPKHRVPRRSSRGSMQVSTTLCCRACADSRQSQRFADFCFVLFNGNEIGKIHPKTQRFPHYRFVP